LGEEQEREEEYLHRWSFAPTTEERRPSGSYVVGNAEEAITSKGRGKYPLSVSPATEKQQQLERILRGNAWFVSILECVREVGPPSWAVGAG
jgi:hypothetical protein